MSYIEDLHLSQGLRGILIPGGKDTSFKIHTRVLACKSHELNIRRNHGIKLNVFV